MDKFSQKTRSFIYPENYHFNTDQAGQMEIIAVSCFTTLDESEKKIHYKEKRAVKVPAQSGFTIKGSVGICEHVCSSLN